MGLGVVQTLNKTMKDIFPASFDEKDYTYICNALEIKTLAGQEALRVAFRNVKMLDNKQQDYGPKNISRHGTIGCVVRITDKIERLKTLTGLSPEVKQKLKDFKSAVAFVRKNELTLSLWEEVTAIDEALDSLISLMGNRRKAKVNETILDTFDDLSNYGIIGRLIETKKWPDSEPLINDK